MVSDPAKLSRCAQPPTMLCSTLAQPLGHSGWWDSGSVRKRGGILPTAPHARVIHCVWCVHTAGLQSDHFSNAPETVRDSSQAAHLKPKSCSLLAMSGLLRPLSLVCSNDCSITSRALRLSVATVVGYLMEGRAGCFFLPLNTAFRRPYRHPQLCHLPLLTGVNAAAITFCMPLPC